MRAERPSDGTVLNPWMIHLCLFWPDSSLCAGMQTLKTPHLLRVHTWILSEKERHWLLSEFERFASKHLLMTDQEKGFFQLQQDRSGYVDR